MELKGKSYFFIRSAIALKKMPQKSIETIKIVTDFIHIVLEKNKVFLLKECKHGPMKDSKKLIGIKQKANLANSFKFFSIIIIPSIKTFTRSIL